jgi:hypothetical protein
MQTTPKKIIIEAYKLLNIVSEENSTVSGSQLQQGFDELQAIIDGWALDKYMSIGDETSTFSMFPGQATYTVGTDVTANIVTPNKPIQIDAFFVVQGNTSYPLQELGVVEFAESCVQSTLTSSIPNYYMYNTTQPHSKLTVYPTPSQVVVSTIVYRITPKVPSTWDEVIDYGAAWVQALKYTLANALSVRYNIDAGNIGVIAAEYKAKIQRREVRKAPRANLIGYTNNRSRGVSYTGHPVV